MATPKTLMQMAGAEPAPHPLGQSAVVVIDAQHEYLDGKLALRDIGPALEEIAALLARARAGSRPVIFVQHQGKSGGAFDPAGRGFAIIEKVQPIKGECIVTKTLPNAFAGTGLLGLLKDHGVTSIIVVGFMTHMCISSTVRAALDLGVACTVVDAACATRDLPDGHGGILEAGELHRAELVALSDRFAMIAEDCEALKD